jgi:hypothetical protein
MGRRFKAGREGWQATCCLEGRRRAGNQLSREPAVYGTVIRRSSLVLSDRELDIVSARLESKTCLYTATGKAGQGVDRLLGMGG